MPPLGEKELNRAIRERSFAPVYYFHGDDDFLKEGAVRQVVDAAADPATRDFNVEIRRGAELDGEGMETLLDTLPMLAERRVVVVRDVAALKKDARRVLDRYLARPAPDTVALLVAAAGAKPDKGLAAVAATLEFRPLSGERLPKWIAHHARTALGAEITPEAVALLQAAAGSDLPTLASELDKLASYARGAGVAAGAGARAGGDGPVTIDEAAVADVVGVRRGETVGDFLDRVAQRDAPGALAMLGHVLSQPKASGVTLVMALAAQTLALAWARARLDEGMPPRALWKALMDDFLKSGGSAYLARPWGEAVTAWTNAVDRWTGPELDRALDLLLDADAALKGVEGAGLSNDEQTIASLVLAMSVPARDRRAA